MSIRNGTFYWLACDFEGCEVESKDEDSGRVHDTEPDALQYEIESMYADEGTWALIDDKHYCWKHTTYCDVCGNHKVLFDRRLAESVVLPRVCHECKAVLR